MTCGGTPGEIDVHMHTEHNCTNENPRKKLLMFVDMIFTCFIITYHVYLHSLTYQIMLPHFPLLLLDVMLSYTLKFPFKVTGGMRFPSTVFCSSDHHLPK